MDLNVSLAEVNLILQLARDSRALIAMFTSAKTTPIHDRVIAKCERGLDERARRPAGPKGGRPHEGT